jgi:hypothetical protein
MRRIGTTVGIAVALLVSLTASTGPVQAGPTGTLTVTPNADLVDFQAVELSGTGLEPGLQEWYTCRGGAVDETDCDGHNADFAFVQGDGTMSETVYVDARIYLPDGTEVDCRTDPAGCVLGVGFMLDAGQHPTVALDFDATAPLRPPVSATVVPSTGLDEQQTVSVHGENLSFREEAFAFVCAAGAGPVGARCDIDQMARTVPDADGRATFDLDLRAAFAPPLGGSVDCRAAGASCSVHVSWGFDPPADRQTAVPVSFAGAPPPPPPPSPLPPTPVPAPVTFTG